MTFLVGDAGKLFWGLVGVVLFVAIAFKGLKTNSEEHGGSSGKSSGGSSSSSSGDSSSSS